MQIQQTNHSILKDKTWRFHLLQGCSRLLHWIAIFQIQNTLKEMHITIQQLIARIVSLGAQNNTV